MSSPRRSLRLQSQNTGEDPLPHQVPQRTGKKRCYPELHELQQALLQKDTELKAASLKLAEQKQVLDERERDALKANSDMQQAVSEAATLKAEAERLRANIADLQERLSNAFTEDATASTLDVSRYKLMVDLLTDEVVKYKFTVRRSQYAEILPLTEEEEQAFRTEFETRVSNATDADAFRDGVSQMLKLTIK